MRFFVIDHSAARRQATDKHIFGDRKFRQKPHFLVNEADAGGDGVAGRGGSVSAPPPSHLSAIRSNGSGDNRRNGRFAGAVFAQQGDDFAAADIEIEVRENFDSSVSLA